MSTTTRLSVLVVDDDPRARRLMQVILEHAGYAVATAPDGESARVMLNDTRPDALISDLQMPGINGIELCAWARRLFGDGGPLLLLLTAQDDDETRRAAADAGIAWIVTKPFDRLEFLARLGELLGTTQRSGK